MRVERYGKTRYWAVIDNVGMLVCLCVYRNGAEEVVKSLQVMDEAQQWQDTNGPGLDVAGNVLNSHPGTASAGRCPFSHEEIILNGKETRK
jgi:hypothetical protein